MGIAIAAVVGLVVVLFGVGFFSVPGLGTSNTGNDNVEGCTAACANLVAKRAQTCSHRAAVAAARAIRDTAAMQAAVAVGVSVAASMVAAAAAAVPIIGPIISAAAAIVAAAAAVYANYLLGRLAGAATALQIQLDGLAAAVKLEADAVTLVNNSCPPAVAMSCISSLPACPV